MQDLWNVRLWTDPYYYLSISKPIKRNSSKILLLIPQLWCKTIIRFFLLNLLEINEHFSDAFHFETLSCRLFCFVFPNRLNFHVLLSVRVEKLLKVKLILRQQTPYHKINDKINVVKYERRLKFNITVTSIRTLIKRVFPFILVFAIDTENEWRMDGSTTEWTNKWMYEWIYESMCLCYQTNEWMIEESMNQMNMNENKNVFADDWINEWTGMNERQYEKINERMNEQNGNTNEWMNDSMNK